MRRRTVLGAGMGVAAGGLLASAGAASASGAPSTTGDRSLARSLPGDFRNGYATVNGVRLHYVEGGSGAPLVLLPGWPRTWWEFHKVMPALAKTHRVIAVDLRGMGESGRPEGGYDKKTMAADIAALARHLGHDSVDVVGSDIGAMVAFSLAANHPDLVRTVTLLDVAHPEDGWYQLPLLPQPGVTFHLWWFAFNQVRGLPERLLAGHARELVDQDAVTDRDRAIYASAYQSRDAVRAGNGWYQAFGQDIADDRTYPPVSAPLLALANPAQYDYLGGLLPTKAVDAEVVRVDGTGHYVVEEQPAAVIDQLTRFLA